jgi:hypothetical protein
VRCSRPTVALRSLCGRPFAITLHKPHGTKRRGNPAFPGQVEAIVRRIVTINLESAWGCVCSICKSSGKLVGSGLLIHGGLVNRWASRQCGPGPERPDDGQVTGQAAHQATSHTHHPIHRHSPVFKDPVMRETREYGPSGGRSYAGQDAPTGQTPTTQSKWHSFTSLSTFPQEPYCPPPTPPLAADQGILGADYVYCQWSCREILGSGAPSGS